MHLHLVIKLLAGADPKQRKQVYEESMLRKILPKENKFGSIVTTETTGSVTIETTGSSLHGTAATWFSRKLRCMAMLLFGFRG